MKEFGRARVALWLAVLAEVALLLQMSGGISEARPEVVVEEEEVDDFVQAIKLQDRDEQRLRETLAAGAQALPASARKRSAAGSQIAASVKRGAGPEIFEANRQKAGSLLAADIQGKKNIPGSTAAPHNALGSVTSHSLPMETERAKLVDVSADDHDLRAALRNSVPAVTASLAEISAALAHISAKPSRFPDDYSFLHDKERWASVGPGRGIVHFLLYGRSLVVGSVIPCSMAGAWSWDWSFLALWLEPGHGIVHFSLYGWSLNRRGLKRSNPYIYNVW